MLPLVSEFVLHEGEKRIEALQPVNDFIGFYAGFLTLSQENQRNGKLVNDRVDELYLFFDTPNQLPLVTSIYDQPLVEVEIIKGLKTLPLHGKLRTLHMRTLCSSQCFAQRT